jgi:hypothetical protein
VCILAQYVEEKWMILKDCSRRCYVDCGDCLRRAYVSNCSTRHESEKGVAGFRTLIGFASEDWPDPPDEQLLVRSH